MISLEGAHTIAGFILETVTGTNGILVPPDGYMQGVRALCDKYGILMIADEVMAGFGRTGKWFAVEHWNVVPDLITMAKGLTSAYVQLGAVGVRRPIADHFATTVSRRPDLQQPSARLRRRARGHRRHGTGRARRTGPDQGELMARMLAELAGRHPSVGAVRSIGLFGIVELVRNRDKRTPMAPFNGTSPEMTELGKFFRQEGLYTFVRWFFFTRPFFRFPDAGLTGGFESLDRISSHKPANELIMSTLPSRLSKGGRLVIDGRR